MVITPEDYPLYIYYFSCQPFKRLNVGFHIKIGFNQDLQHFVNVLSIHNFIQLHKWIKIVAFTLTTPSKIMSLPNSSLPSNLS